MKKILAILLTVATLFSLTACGAGGNVTGNVTPDGEQVYSAGQITVNTDTALTGTGFFTDAWGGSTADRELRSLINGYETITYTKRGQFEVNTTAVEKMDISDHGDGSRTYTFTLQKGLQFSDGSPITATDYVFSVLLQNAPAFADIDGANNQKSPELLGYEAFHAGETNAFQGVRLLGEHRFSLTVRSEALPCFSENALVQVTPYPMALLAPSASLSDSESGVILENLSAEELASTIGDPQTGYRYSPSVSAGAYRFVQYDASTQQAVVEANPYFKGNYEGQKPSIQTICLTSSETDRITALEAHSADLITHVTDGVQIEAGLSLVEDKAANSTIYEQSGYYCLHFACDLEPVNFTAVRQAIAHLIDVPAFTKEQTGGYGTSVFGMYGTGLWAAQQAGSELQRTTNDYSYDLSSAISLLEADGWNRNANGSSYTGGIRYKQTENGLIPLEIHWAVESSDPIGKQLAATLPDICQSAGIQLQVAYLETDAFLQSFQRSHDAPLYRMYSCFTPLEADFDPQFTLADETLSQLTVSLRQTDPSDTNGYLAKWQEFQQYWNQQLPDIPLYSGSSFDFSSTQLRGYGNISAFWDWTQQILYCWVGRE